MSRRRIIINKRKIPGQFRVSNQGYPGNIDGRGSRVYIRLGTTHLTPYPIWKNYKKYPRRTHPPLNLAYQGVTKAAVTEMIFLIKKSTEYNRMIQIYLKCYYEQQIKPRKDTSKLETEKMLVSSSDDEKFINEPEITIKLYSTGIIANAEKNPLMNIFKVPYDNQATLKNLHYELSTLLFKNKSSISHAHSMQPNISINFALIPQGLSRSSNYRRTNIIKRIIDSNELMNQRIILL